MAINWSGKRRWIALILLIAGFVVMMTMGEMLAPVLAGVIIAYLLDGVVEKCRRYGAPRLSAVVLVFLLFLSFLAFALAFAVKVPLSTVCPAA